MEKFYQTMLSNIRKHPLLQKIIMGFTRYIPIITFIVYSILQIGRASCRERVLWHV